MLEDIELGYAVTVRKTQGSQWQRVIIPITGSKLLDRTLLYTALTGAQTQVLLIGDVAAARVYNICSVSGLPALCGAGLGAKATFS